VRTAVRRRAQKYFLAVAGNIGSGKSSLTDCSAPISGWKPYFESVEDNPYLSDFYADMKRWSFNLQVYFLSNRIPKSQDDYGGDHHSLPRPRHYEDAEIFARNLYEIGNMERGLRQLRGPLRRDDGIPAGSGPA